MCSPDACHDVRARLIIVRRPSATTELMASSTWHRCSASYRRTGISTAGSAISACAVEGGCLPGGDEVRVVLEYVHREPVAVDPVLEGVGAVDVLAGIVGGEGMVVDNLVAGVQIGLQQRPVEEDEPAVLESRDPLGLARRPPAGVGAGGRLG